ncbi:MAG TPA: DUF485 domain-containing protein [Dehalococcoidales bacterium]|nr:DUF485 domain-containing protein [Dehalococcoidales bacterium]
MSHGPSTEWKTEKSEGYKSKLGLIMFAFYAPLYLLFVLICVIFPKTMGIDIGPLNLAIVFGFGLIVIAIILALVYNMMCSKREKLDHIVEHKEGGTNK